MKNRIILINFEPVKLGQLLKIEGLINSGSKAKYFLSENDVYVNHKKENRRGRKIFFGDIVNVNDKEYLISKEKDRG